MEKNLKNRLEKIAEIDIFQVATLANNFVGYPFYLDYKKANLLTCDDWKYKSGGVPQGCLMLAFYNNPFNTVQSEEAILLRAIKPCAIPSDSDLITSKIEFYKEDVDITTSKSKGNALDDFTRFEFSFSGIECSILGTFYKNENGKIEFGADVENFFSSHYYKVYKITDEYLEFVVNKPDDATPLNPDATFPIGKVRYSSSKTIQSIKISNSDAKVYVHTNDILGKRTALFGMTRTGKSNTVKKIIEATEKLSQKAPHNLKSANERFEERLKPFTKDNIPKYPVGQIIFDINGEYANKNLQDGTAIFEKYKDKVTRYSVLKKDGFKQMKVNFYEEIEAGFELIKSHLINFSSTYHNNFRAITLEKPDNYEPTSSEGTRYDRLKAAYLCCLYKAGFPIKNSFKIIFRGNADLNKMVTTDSSVIPDSGLSLEQATNWLLSIWKEYNTNKYFVDYKNKHQGKEWADEDLKAVLTYLSREKDGRRIDGYTVLRDLKELHTETIDTAFDIEINNQLTAGNIVIIDLSQGEPSIQRLFSERICRKLFKTAMNNFVNAQPNNFMQFYFEEAHNLFPKKDDKDLSQIYNRIAKEGAKLNLGLIYATQEVSSISSNILKNTQNWFIAHLNNEDEIKELRKFYDFSDFADSLIRFSAKNDKGFVRMKTYSNPFVVPVQIDLFE